MKKIIRLFQLLVIFTLVGCTSNEDYLMGENERLANQVEVLELDNAELSDSKEKTINDFEDEIDGLNKEIEKLMNEKTSLEYELENVDNGENGLQTIIDDLNSRIDTLNETITALEGVVDNKTNTISKLQSQIDTLNTQLEEYSIEVNPFSNKVLFIVYDDDSDFDYTSNTTAMNFKARGYDVIQVDRSGFLGISNVDEYAAILMQGYREYDQEYSLDVVDKLFSYAYGGGLVLMNIPGLEHISGEVGSIFAVELGIAFGGQVRVNRDVDADELGDIYSGISGKYSIYYINQTISDVIKNGDVFVEYVDGYGVYAEADYGNGMFIFMEQSEEPFGLIYDTITRPLSNAESISVFVSNIVDMITLVRNT
ncbi:hypothetical protein RJG79_08535 [Mycoplasmatota bacterium WC44]